MDNFFSKKVTHVVTSRPVPSGGKENSPSVANADAAHKQPSHIQASLESAATLARAKMTSARSPASYSLLTGQKIRA